MRNANVKHELAINVFGTLADFDYLFLVDDANGYQSDLIEDFIQERYDDWMENDDTDKPLCQHIVETMEADYGIILKPYGEII